MKMKTVKSAKIPMTEAKPRPMRLPTDWDDFFMGLDNIGFRVSF